MYNMIDSEKKNYSICFNMFTYFFSLSEKEYILFFKQFLISTSAKTHV